MDLGYSSDSDFETNQKEESYEAADWVEVKLPIPSESNVLRKKKALESLDVGVINDALVDETKEVGHRDTNRVGDPETTSVSNTQSTDNNNTRIFDGDAYYNDNKLMKAELASAIDSPSFNQSRSNQLSNLIIYTEKNKEKLEERFINDRMKKKRKQSEYGF
ncbi:BA75_02599T0 [Komagataella pastoris]|uniref:BA75_02599T0 n=1 Tax=Komagataella pastoris TaxID=4922 RepID=A0A1B2JCI9_PICPA|nr:BA75_02599T0 [Komagataella pastoris]